MPPLDAMPQAAHASPEGPAAPGKRFDPDAEALALAARVIAKARVARSFLRLAASAAASAAGEVSIAEIARISAVLDALTRPRPARSRPGGTATPPARVSPEGGAAGGGG
jgi:hypothetical protein